MTPWESVPTPTLLAVMVASGAPRRSHACSKGGEAAAAAACERRRQYSEAAAADVKNKQG